MSSTFDPDQFLEATFNEASRTQPPEVPPGEYVAQIRPGSLSYRTANTKDGEKPLVEFYWVISDASVSSITGRPESSVRQTIWLNQKSDGSIDIEGSDSLGRLRTAVGLNEKGQPFAFRMLEGKTARVRVTQDIRKDTGEPQSQVKSVTKA